MFPPPVPGPSHSRFCHNYVSKYNQREGADQCGTGDDRKAAEHFRTSGLRPLFSGTGVSIFFSIRTECSRARVINFGQTGQIIKVRFSLPAFPIWRLPASRFPEVRRSVLRVPGFSAEFLKPFCHFHTHHLRTKDNITGSCMLPTVDCGLSTTGCGYVLHPFLQSPASSLRPYFLARSMGGVLQKSLSLIPDLGETATDHTRVSALFQNTASDHVIHSRRFRVPAWFGSAPCRRSSSHSAFVRGISWYFWRKR